MNNKKSTAIISTVAIITIAIMIIGATFAFFQAEGGTPVTSDVRVQAHTVDTLVFDVSDDLEFEVDQTNFGENGTNVSGEATVSAMLTPNSKTGTATDNYSIYLNMNANNIIYSRTNTNEDPELLLQVFDENDQLVTLTGLGTQKTIKGLSGYDITNRGGIIPLKENEAITASNSETATEEWRVVITMINHDFDQQDNTGKQINGELIVRKTPITYSTLLAGEQLNVKMKQIAEPENSSITENAYVNTNITRIAKYNGTPSASVLVAANEVSQANETKKTYMWFDNGTLYWYSEADIVKLNADCKRAFQLFQSLTDISGLADFNTTDVTTMYGMFLGRSATPMHIASLEPLANWNVSNVTDMAYMFQLNVALTSLHGLENWNTSNVTTMYGMLIGNNAVSMHITSLEPLANWNVSNVTIMQAMFQGNADLVDLHGLENWDTSNVIDMKNMFSGAVSLQSLKGLEKWDVSNVTTMYGMFLVGGGLSRINDVIIDLTPLANWDVSGVQDMTALLQNSNIKSFEPLANWDVSSVKNFSSAFNQTSASTLKTLHGLENWDTSSATNMEDMFADGYAFEDVSAINKWNISLVTNFNTMFLNAKNGIHPTFEDSNGTPIPGTWSNGTFTKSS